MKLPSAIALRATVLLDPGSFEGWLRLAEVARGLKRFPSALRFAGRCAILRPVAAAPWLARAAACREAGDGDGALDAFAAAVRRDLPFARRTELSYRLLQDGRHVSAAGGLRRVAASFDDPYEATRQACLAASLRGEWAAADRFARAALSMHPPAASRTDARRPAAETARFSDAFFAGLPGQRDSGSGLPEVAVEGTPEGQGPLILVSFDDAYARAFAARHLEVARAGASRYRLHLIDPADDTLATVRAAARGLPAVSVSWERPGLAAAGWDHRLAYYSCIRFVRAAGLLAEGAGEILMSDADNILQPAATGALGDDYDLALVADGRRIPWFSYNVSAVHLTGSEACRAYLDLVARYIGHFLRAGTARWRLDQNAFFCTASWLERQGRAPRIGSLLERADALVARKLKFEERA